MITPCQHLCEVPAAAWQYRPTRGRSAPMLCRCSAVVLLNNQVSFRGAEVGATAEHGMPFRVAWAATLSAPILDRRSGHSEDPVVAKGCKRHLTPRSVPTRVITLCRFRTGLVCISWKPESEMQFALRLPVTRLASCSPQFQPFVAGQRLVAHHRAVFHQTSRAAMQGSGHNTDDPRKFAQVSLAGSHPCLPCFMGTQSNIG